MITVLKGLLLAGVLLYAAVRDIRTHEVPDWVWAAVVGFGLIGIHLQDLPGMIFSAAAVLLIQIPAAVIMKERALGGADIKISAAGAFLLGGMRGLYALILGLALAVITVPLLRLIRRQNGKQPFALVPYLAVGIMTVFLFM